jgi:hypothetical protein
LVLSIYFGEVGIETILFIWLEISEAHFMTEAEGNGE